MLNVREIFPNKKKEGDSLLFNEKEGVKKLIGNIILSGLLSIFQSDLFLFQLYQITLLRKAFNCIKFQVVIVFRYFCFLEVAKIL